MQLDTSLEPPQVGHFSISSEDAEILEEYIEEFQDTDSELWTRIVANAMTQLAMLWPEDEPFDKAIANKVSLYLTR